VNKSRVTLKDVKDKCPKRVSMSEFRYFFRMELEEMEVLQKEDDDSAEVPLLGSKVVVECRGPEC
jgi:hypothetical protein